MKKLFAVNVVLVVFLLSAGWTDAFGTESPAPDRDFYTPPEIARKNLDLESLNLIRSLELSTEQMLKLLPLLYETRLLEREVFLGYKKDSAHAMEMLNMLQEKIYMDDGIDVPTEEKVWFALGTLYEYEYDRHQSLERQVEKAREILNRNQLQVVSEYMPCIIPWSSIKAPRRIGQAGSIQKLEMILDQLRPLSGEAYQQAKRDYLVELDWRLRIDRHEDDRTRQILVREIDSKIDRIHQLPEEEYQIRKTELAQSIRPPDLEIRPPRTGEELDEYIREYVLNPANIRYIQLQLEKADISYPESHDEIDIDIDEDMDMD